MKDKEFDCVTE